MRERLIGRGTVFRAGMPWHGRLDNSGLRLPNNELRPEALCPVSEGHTWLVDFGMPDVATSPADAAAGMSWRNSCQLFGLDRRYSPFSSQGIGYGRWLWRSPQGMVWRCWISVSPPAVQYLRGDAVDLGITVSCQPFGVFDARAAAAAVLQRPVVQLSLGPSVRDGRLLSMQFDHAPDGGLAAFAVRIGHRPAGVTSVRGQLALDASVQAVIRVDVIGVDDAGAPLFAVATEFLWSQYASLVEQSTPAAAPGTVMQEAVNASGQRCLPAKNDLDISSTETTLIGFVLRAYTDKEKLAGVNVISSGQHVSGYIEPLTALYYYSFSPAGNGEILLPEIVQTPENPYYNDAEDNPCAASGGVQVVIESIEYPQISIDVPVSWNAKIEVSILAGDALICKKEMSENAIYYAHVSADSLTWSPPLVCYYGGDAWTPEPVPPVVDFGTPVGEIVISVDGEQVATSSTWAGGAVYLYYGSGLYDVTLTDQDRGRWVSMAARLATHDLVSIVGVGGDAPGFPVAAWVDSVHRTTGDGAAQIDQPRLAGSVAQCIIVAAIDRFSGEISMPQTGNVSYC